MTFVPKLDWKEDDDVTEDHINRWEKGIADAPQVAIDWFNEGEEARNESIKEWASGTFATKKRMEILKGMPGINILRNPTFANKLKGWTMNNSGAPFVTEHHNTVGNVMACRESIPANTWKWVDSDPMNVVPSTDYTISALFHSIGLTDSECFQIELWDHTNSVKLSGGLVADAGKWWHTKSFTFKTPASCYQLRVRIVAGPSPATAKYISQIKVEESTYATPFTRDRDLDSGGGAGYTVERGVEGGTNLPKGTAVILTRDGQVKKASEVPPYLVEGPYVSRTQDWAVNFRFSYFMTEDIYVLGNTYLPGSGDTDYFKFWAVTHNSSDGVGIKGPMNTQSAIKKTYDMPTFLRINDTQFAMIGGTGSPGAGSVGGNTWALELYEINPQTLEITQIGKFQDTTGGWSSSYPIGITHMGNYDFVAMEGSITYRTRLLRYNPITKTFTGFTPSTYETMWAGYCYELARVSDDTFLRFWDNNGWNVQMVRVDRVNGTFTYGARASVSSKSGSSGGRNQLQISRLRDDLFILIGQLGSGGTNKLNTITANPSNLTVIVRDQMSQWTGAGFQASVYPMEYQVNDDGTFYAFLINMSNTAPYIKLITGTLGSDGTLTFNPSSVPTTNRFNSLAKDLYMTVGYLGCSVIQVRKNSRVVQFVAQASASGNNSYGWDSVVFYYGDVGNPGLYGIVESCTNGIATVKVMGIMEDMAVASGMYYASYGGKLMATLSNNPNRIGKGISDNELMLLSF
jgi:hypothetical protein